VRHNYLIEPYLAIKWKEKMLILTDSKKVQKITFLKSTIFINVYLFYFLVFSQKAFCDSLYL